MNEGVSEVTAWGPKENRRASSPTPPKKRRPIPGFRHIFAGVIGTIAVSFLIVIVAGAYLVSKDPSLAMDIQGLSTQLTELISSNVIGIVFSLLLTWLALTLPIFWAGRKFEGGWKKMIGWKFAWKIDIGIALGFAVSVRLLEYIVNTILKYFGIDTDSLGNGGVLEAAGSKWLLILIIAASIGAPIAEELFFRGLVLKVVSQKFGQIMGVIISATLFGLSHFQGTLAGTIYMFPLTAIIGVLLALLVLKTKRLGTSILSHGAFNASAGLFVILGF